MDTFSVFINFSDSKIVSSAMSSCDVLLSSFLVPEKNGHCDGSASDHSYFTIIRYFFNLEQILLLQICRIGTFAKISIKVLKECSAPLEVDNYRFYDYQVIIIVGNPTANETFFQSYKQLFQWYI